MVINLMSWNTALYEFKNTSFKKSGLDNENFLKKVYKRIKVHLNKENAVAVLQEIPFKSNFDWKEHPIFTEVKKDFPADQYDLLYNLSTKNQIMMTVVVAKRGIIKNNPNGINTNRFVSFNIKDISLVGIHSKNAYQLREALQNIKGNRPDIIIGDFNAGNYYLNDKDKDDEIAVNRNNYLLLTEEYIDLCQGKVTTTYNRYIDHILIKSNHEFLSKCKCMNVNVDNNVKLSDHFPIYCTIETE